MSAEKNAYSATVVSRGQIVVGALAGAVISAPLIVFLPGSPVWPLLIGLLVFVTGIYLATVRVVVGGSRLVLVQGPFGRPRRVIPVSLVTDAHAELMSRPQAFGIGVPWHWRTTRMTVGPGPALALRLTTGEYIRISTPDPDAAVAIIRSAHSFPSTAAPA